MQSPQMPTSHAPAPPVDQAEALGASEAPDAHRSSVTIQWGGQTVRWPVELTVAVDPEDPMGVEARLTGADGVVLERFPATLEELIQGEATASVVGRAAAKLERMESLWETHHGQMRQIEAARAPVSPASAFAPLSVGASLGIAIGMALGSALGGLDWGLPLAFTGAQIGWWWSWSRLRRGAPPRWWPSHWSLALLIRLRQQDLREAQRQGTPRPEWFSNPLPLTARLAPVGLAVAGLISLGQLARGSPTSILAVVPGVVLWHWGLRQMRADLSRLPEAPGVG